MSESRTSEISINGTCACGNVRCQIRWPVETVEELKDVQPRACDCHFCVDHNCSYISHPKGAISLTCARPEATRHISQEDSAGLALFHLCNDCNMLTHVSYREGPLEFAALNFRMIPDYQTVFGSPVSVSPRNLSPSEKTERWKANWFTVVSD